MRIEWKYNQVIWVCPQHLFCNKIPDGPDRWLMEEYHN
jgi:hypothetical protein